MRFAALPEVALEADEDGSWHGSLILTKDTDYWIELADTKGHLGVNEKPYHIKALPDNPPKVEITEPGQDMRASATNKVPLKISVTDDFGVGAIKVIFHKLGGPEQTILANRESVERIAEELIRRKEMHGDEVVDLLNSVELLRPKVDLLEEKTWPPV